MSISRDYVVLKLPEGAKAATATPSLSGGLESKALNRPDGPRAIEGLEIRVDVLDEQQAGEIKRDKRFAAAPLMSLKLFEPVVRTAANPAAAQPALWGLEAVGATRPGQMTGRGVTVAVLDTGIQRTHEAFSRFNANTLVERDFTRSGNGDTHGHGTHCAGTIFGGEVQGRRIGVAPGVDKVLIGKVIGTGASTASLISALQWALSEGAHVISMSLGIDFPGLAADLQDRYGMDPAMATSKALEGYRDNLRLFDALATLVRQSSAFGKASVLIAATGNESQRQIDADHTIAVAPPAVGDGIIAVGAVDEQLRIADFSNTGPTLVGPGVDVLSANIKGGLVAMSGTSMATPHVAGVAALWFESLMASGARITMDTVTKRMIDSARRLPASETDVGNGLVQAPV